MIGDEGSTKRFRIVVNILAVLTAFALLLSAWALNERFNQTNSIRSENKAVWHAVICAIEQATVENPRSRPTDKRIALAFYDKLLVDDIHTGGCGLRVK